MGVAIWGSQSLILVDIVASFSGALWSMHVAFGSGSGSGRQLPGTQSPPPPLFLYFRIAHTATVVFLLLLPLHQQRTVGAVRSFSSFFGRVLLSLQLKKFEPTRSLSFFSWPYFLTACCTSSTLWLTRTRETLGSAWSSIAWHVAAW